MAKREFRLPDLGEGIHEGEIIAVRVASGERVAEGDVILEVETDKAAVEIPSPYSGVVAAVNVAAGDEVRVGQVLLVIADDAPAEAAAPGTAPEADAPPARPGPRPPERTAPSADDIHRPGTARPAGSKEPVPASPATRRLARELAVDLARVTGSGPAGLVTAEDVRAFAGQDAAARQPDPDPRRTAAPPPAAQTADAVEMAPQQIPYRSVRRAIGRQMARAWAEIPHVTTQDEVDITRLELLRRRRKAWVAARGGHLSLTVLILKAALQALKAFPEFNASLDLQAGVIQRHREHHVGIAVDTPDGLIVPVVRHADHRSILDLSIAVKELVARTRERKVSLAELQGGTFTITNVGRDGGSFFTPIINPPQVAILGVGGARVRPVMVRDQAGRFSTVPRLILPLTLTIDHRVLDGADAGRFLKLLKQMLCDPDKLLLVI